MKKSAKKKRPRQWTLAKVVQKCRVAPAVFMALQEMARSGSVATPTRSDLVLLTGVNRLRTISTALTVLHDAAWIERIHVPVTDNGQRTATLLRIILRRKGQISTQDSSEEERGGPTAPAPIAVAGAEADRPWWQEPPMSVSEDAGDAKRSASQ